MHAFLATAIVLPTVAVSVIPEEGLVSFWDFQETSGPFTAKLGSGKYTLEEAAWDNDTRTWSSGNTVARVRDVPPGAPFGPQSASLTQEQMLNIRETQKRAPLLNIHGDNATLSVVAWVKPGEMEHKAGFGHVVGIWSEPIDARTYVLFAPGSSRGGWNHLDAEVSRTGLTMQPACRWSTSYALGEANVTTQAWHMLAMTFDGKSIRAFVNGTLDYRPPHRLHPVGDVCSETWQNPAPVSTWSNRTEPGTWGPGGDPKGNITDFTIGGQRETPCPDGVPCAGGLAHGWYGLLGGLAVYDRALSSEELLSMAHATMRKV